MFRHLTLFCFLFLKTYFVLCQVGNYIGNGSFEKDCFISGNPVFWPGIDSINCNGGTLCSECSSLGNAPSNSYTYQKAHTGGAYMVCTFFFPNVSVGYLKNRLKQKLIANKTYCVKFYVNITNNSSYGIDALGIFFANNTLDTITKCSVPLTYITPQIENLTGNIITDTLNWVSITGTFVANGTEKYALLGNFKPDLLINKTLINPLNLPSIFTDFCIDDVSCIPLNMEAYAGPDKSIIPGDSVYIGRESDFAIDPGCIWYKLPNTTTAIDTISGMWVKPTVTSTYVVKQTLDCSPEKWDTVVVYINPLGIEKLKAITEGLKLFPVPAKDELQLSLFNKESQIEFYSLSIFNNLGLLVWEQELIPFEIDARNTKINTEDLSNGVYFIQLKNNLGEGIRKLFVISR